MATQTFESWLAAVDRIVIAKVGLGIEDGIDWPSRDTFDDGATPKEGAQVWAACQDYDGLEDLFN